MTIPPSGHRVWSDLVTGKIKLPMEFLALKIKLGNVAIRLRTDASPATIAACAAEVRSLLESNAQLPSAKRDIERIVSQA